MEILNKFSPTNEDFIRTHFDLKDTDKRKNAAQIMHIFPNMLLKFWIQIIWNSDYLVSKPATTKKKDWGPIGVFK